MTSVVLHKDILNIHFFKKSQCAKPLLGKTSVKPLSAGVSSMAVLKSGNCKITACSSMTQRACHRNSLILPVHQHLIRELSSGQPELRAVLGTQGDRVGRPLCKTGSMEPGNAGAVGNG